MLRSAYLRRRSPMPKGKTLARGKTELRRRSPIRPVTKNRAKRAARFERAFLSREYVAFIHSQPCAAPGCGRRDIQCAHVGRPRSRGGRWYEIAPLCGSRDWPGHHQEQEKRTSAFDAKYGTDLEALAAALAFDHLAFIRKESEAAEAVLHVTAVRLPEP